LTGEARGEGGINLARIALNQASIAQRTSPFKRFNCNYITCASTVSLPQNVWPIKQHPSVPTSTMH